MALSPEDRQEIADIVKETVNGKIDRLSESFSEHKEEMEPIVKGWRTVNNGRNFIVWVGAPLAVIGTIVTFFK